jgi:hypothetical protein
MTSDPKAPGAAAVYLEIKEMDNDPMHFQTYYARIKVLTEKGKELATVDLPYLKDAYKITDVEARTIHADGTIVPLEGKIENLLIFKKGDSQIDHQVFTLPSVEVGSILEYRYEVHYQDFIFSSPDWHIQKPYFVHKAHYQFTPYRSFMPGHLDTFASTEHLIDSNGEILDKLLWWSRLPDGVSVKDDSGGFYTVDVTDVPASPKEEWMPPIDSILLKVSFYYKHAESAQDFWLKAAKRWSGDTDHFAEPNAALRKAVAGLIDPSDSDLIKAQKLYAAVQALDNTDYSRAKSESELKQLKLKDVNRATDVWTQKSGSANDIALLYLSMLRAAGLTAYATKVVDREKGVFDPGYMYIGQFDSTLVILNAGGKEIFLDPGEKMCSFGMLSWKHSDAKGIRQSAQGLRYTTTDIQDYKANTTTRTGDVTLDAQGAVTGSFRFIMAGQEALRWRQIALKNDDTEVKKKFDRELEEIVPEGVEAHVDHFLGMDQADVNLLAVVNVKGSLGAATSKRLMLPGFFFEARGNQPFINQEKRQIDIDMHYGEHVTDQVTYHLPAGLTVEGAPQNSDAPWTGHAIYSTRTELSPNQITVSRSFARAFTLAKPGEYNDLRGFYQKVAAADQQQIVLTTSATAAVKGN